MPTSRVTCGLFQDHKCRLCMLMIPSRVDISCEKRTIDENEVSSFPWYNQISAYLTYYIRLTDE